MYFSTLSFWIITPPIMAIANPSRLYNIVALIPNIAGKRYKEDSLIKGELIKKAKVIPKGIPAPRKPMNKGIEEQEQKGVTIPRIAAIK
jgi:hypothetical protein